MTWAVTSASLSRLSWIMPSVSPTAEVVVPQPGHRDQMGADQVAARGGPDSSGVGALASIASATDPGPEAVIKPNPLDPATSPPTGAATDEGPSRNYWAA